MSTFDLDTYKCIKKGIEIYIEEDENFKFKTFKDFFAEIDVINAYEESWKPDKFKKRLVK